MSQQPKSKRKALKKPRVKKDWDAILGLTGTGWTVVGWYYDRILRKCRPLTARI